MNTNQTITLSRDCEAVQIPWGQTVFLTAGTPVMITQSLGGSYTVVTDRGEMLRIAGKDADAVGEAPPSNSPVQGISVNNSADIEKLVWGQLRTIYDPEIPTNIVDLGLVYQCQVISLPGSWYEVDVAMTLTAPGCGMGEVLKKDAETKIRGIPQVSDVRVEIVMDPPWDRNMMSDAAKLGLGMM